MNPHDLPTPEEIAQLRRQAAAQAQTGPEQDEAVQRPPAAPSRGRSTEPRQYRGRGEGSVRQDNRRRKNDHQNDHRQNDKQRRRRPRSQRGRQRERANEVNEADQPMTHETAGAGGRTSLEADEGGEGEAQLFEDNELPRYHDDVLGYDDPNVHGMRAFSDDEYYFSEQPPSLEESISVSLSANRGIPSSGTKGKQRAEVSPKPPKYDEAIAADNTLSSDHPLAKDDLTTATQNPLAISGAGPDDPYRSSSFVPSGGDTVREPELSAENQLQDTTPVGNAPVDIGQEVPQEPQYRSPFAEAEATFVQLYRQNLALEKRVFELEREMKALREKRGG